MLTVRFSPMAHQWRTDATPTGHRCGFESFSNDQARITAAVVKKVFSIASGLQAPPHR
jgi:hypothetical protein